MNLSNQDVQLAQENFVSSSTQQHPLGTRGCDLFGRVYRYVKAGASDLVAGNVVQSPANIAGHLVRAVNTTTPTGIGATYLTLTCASSAAANFYAEGYLAIVSGSGQGVAYYLGGHAAVSTGATGQFNFYGNEEVLRQTITTTTTVSLYPNKYNGVIQMPVTTATGVVVGVAHYIITAAQYGWIQTWGPCAVLTDDTTALGAPVNAVAGTAGRASGFTAASLLTGQTLGNLMSAGVAAQHVLIDLKVSP